MADSDGDVDDEPGFMVYSLNDAHGSHAAPAHSPKRAQAAHSAPAHSTSPKHPSSAPRAEKSAEGAAAAAATNVAAPTTRWSQAAVTAAVGAVQNSRPPSSDEVLRRQRHDEMLAQRELLDLQKRSVVDGWESEMKRWEKQVQGYQSILKRMDVMEQTSADLKAYLTARLTRLESFFATAAYEEKTFCANEIGTLRQAAMALELLNQSCVKHFEEAKKCAFQESISQTSKWVTDIHKQSSQMKKTGSRLADNVTTMRVTTKKSWESYEKAMADHLRDRGEGRELLAANDPYLFARKYIHNLGESRKTQVEYGEEMNKLFREMKLMDGRRIEMLKALLTDHLIAEKSLLQSKLQYLDESLDAVKAIDREKDVLFFTQREQLEDDIPEGLSLYAAPNPLEDMSIVERLRGHVLMRAELARPGKIFSSNWKNGIGVITLAEVFHFFDHAEDDHPTFSLSLTVGSVEATSDRHPDAFSLTLP